MNSKRSPLNSFLNPKTVAIVGASRSPLKVGHLIAKNLIEGQTPAKIFLVNPKAKTILSRRVYPTLSSLPQVPDCVYITLPAPLVKLILEECLVLGIKSAVVVSAGFAESGSYGTLLQKELQAVIRDSSLRVLGPNCLGVINPLGHFNGSFGPALPAQGSLFLISQSGALITSILDWAKIRHLGLSAAVSLGNRIDVNENDFLEYATKDPQTRVIAVYLESSASLRTFFQKASQITPHKPVVLLKGGSSTAGAQASASHTAALATDSVLVEAMCRQTGVIQTHSLESWLSSSQLLAAYPRGAGPRLGLITNAGGPGVLAVDAAANSGLVLPPLKPTLSHKLKAKLTLATVHNPLDLLGDALPESFATAAQLMLEAPEIDQLLFIISPQAMTQPLKIAQMFTQKLSFPSSKPVVVNFIGGEKMALAKKTVLTSGLPTYDYPQDAIAALSVLPAQAHNRQVNSPRLLPLPIPSPANPKLPLSQPSFFKLLQTVGLTLPKQVFIEKLESVPEALAQVGRPAVFKNADPNLLHKAITGGVVIDVMTNIQGRNAFRHLTRSYSEVLVQQTVHSQSQIILGGKVDPEFGPFLTVGLGGSYTNILKDRQYVFLPCGESEYLRALKNAKAYQVLLQDHIPPELVLDSMQRLSKILLTQTDIAEMEINPLMCTPKACFAVDIKIQLKS